MKGEILEESKGEENPSSFRRSDKVELGQGMKPREETIQTHRWIQKSKLADREYLYWILSTGSPPIKILLWAKFLSFESSKDRSIEAELEVQIRKGKNFNLTTRGRSRSASWQTLRE